MYRLTPCERDCPAAGSFGGIFSFESRCHSLHCTCPACPFGPIFQAGLELHLALVLGLRTGNVEQVACTVRCPSLVLQLSEGRIEFSRLQPSCSFLCDPSLPLPFPSGLSRVWKRVHGGLAAQLCKWHVRSSCQVQSKSLSASFCSSVRQSFWCIALIACRPVPSCIYSLLTPCGQSEPE